MTFSPFPRLACFPSPLTTHSWFFQFVRSLIYLGSALATYGSFLYFSKSTFKALWVVSIQIDFNMRDVLFIYTISHHYSIKGYTPISISSFMWFSLFFFSLFFLCIFVRILSIKIYFLWFFLAYFLIALELLFLHGIRATGTTTFPFPTWYQSYRDHNLSISYMVS